jgi:hypothetical protein
LGHEGLRRQKTDIPGEDAKQALLLTENNRGDPYFYATQLKS